MAQPTAPQRPLRDHIRVIPGTRNASAFSKAHDFDDAKLMALLQSSSKELHGVRVVHIHLALLTNAEESDALQVLRLLAEASADSDYVQTFRISNGDIVMLYRAVKFSTVDEVCRKIEASLAGKPRQTAANPYQEDALYSILELSRNFVRVIRYLEGLIKTHGPGVQGAREAKPPITPEELAKIDHDLKRFDLSPYLFNQAVINMREDDERSCEYYELYIAIAELQAQLCPDFDLTANCWLFKHFTSRLDERLLRRLSQGLELVGAARIGVNINIATALSPIFQSFDERLPATFRGRVILEIDKTDLIENIADYRDLLAFAGEREYLVCLDGMNPLWVTQFDLEALGCRYVKLFWSNDLMSLDDVTERRLLDKIAAGKNGGCQFILARCGATTALLYANKNGIDLVQGQAVDAISRKGIRIKDAISTAIMMEG